MSASGPSGPLVVIFQAGGGGGGRYFLICGQLILERSC